MPLQRSLFVVCSSWCMFWSMHMHAALSGEGMSCSSAQSCCSCRSTRRVLPRTEVHFGACL
jgi:hypothetical protein